MKFLPVRRSPLGLSAFVLNQTPKEMTNWVDKSNKLRRSPFFHRRLIPIRFRLLLDSPTANPFSDDPLNALNGAIRDKVESKRKFFNRKRASDVQRLQVLEND